MFFCQSVSGNTFDMLTVVTKIFCSHWLIIDIIAIIHRFHTYSNKRQFTFTAFHDIFISFTEKNVDNMTDVTLLKLVAILKLIFPRKCKNFVLSKSGHNVKIYIYVPLYKNILRTNAMSHYGG